MQIGIIGFGRFGQLASHYLAKDFKVLVYNRANKSTENNRTGARPGVAAGHRSATGGRRHSV